MAQVGDVAQEPLCRAVGSPWPRAPLGRGGPAGDTHTVTLLPLAAVGSGQAALAFPSLQENEGGEVTPLSPCPGVPPAPGTAEGPHSHVPAAAGWGSWGWGGHKPTLGPGGPSVT